MIWGATAVISEAYDGLNLLTTGVVGVFLPAQRVERQRELIQMAERLHAEEVRVEAGMRGLTVKDLLAEIQEAAYAIVELNALADYQEDLAWEFYEQGVIRRWDDAIRAIPPHRRPAAGEYTKVPDEEFLPLTSGIYEDKPQDPPDGLVPLNQKVR